MRCLAARARRASVLPVLGAVLALAVKPAAAADAKPRPAQHPRFAQAVRLFEGWLEGQVAYDRIPGLTVGLVLDQDLVWSRALGYADVAARRPMTTDTLFGICSISKLFTAVAVLQERDAGRLRLDDPVAAHLPYFKLPPAGDDGAPVTIRGLLTHSSGVPRESAHSYWTAPEFAFPSREDIVAGLSGQKMLYPADRYYQYSNLGITLAGHVVEKTSGRPYADYVRDHILTPLKLADTSPSMPAAERGKRLATGYGVLGREGTRQPMPFYDARGVTPAAGFASSLEDLAAFASWQFRLLEGGGQEVLKASTLREMHRVHWVDPDWKTMWGLGFSVRREGDQTRVGHSGACPGYRTTLRLVPRDKMALIVMINAMGVMPEDLATELGELVAPVVKEANGATAPPKTPDPALEAYAGLYRSAWGETLVVPWKDGLAALGLPRGDPTDDLVSLKRVEGGLFRRVRKDDDTLAEEVAFLAGPDGRVERMRWHQNDSLKVR